MSQPKYQPNTFTEQQCPHLHGEILQGSAFPYQSAVLIMDQFNKPPLGVSGCRKIEIMRRLCFFLLACQGVVIELLHSPGNR